MAAGESLSKFKFLRVAADVGLKPDLQNKNARPTESFEFPSDLQPSALLPLPRLLMQISNPHRKL